MSRISIVGTKKAESGTLTNFMLSNGKEITKQEAVAMVESGKLKDYRVAIDKYGGKSIRVSNKSNKPSLSILGGY